MPILLTVLKEPLLSSPREEDGDINRSVYVQRKGNNQLTTKHKNSKKFEKSQIQAHQRATD